MVFHCHKSLITFAKYFLQFLHFMRNLLLPLLLFFLPQIFQEETVQARFNQSIFREQNSSHHRHYLPNTFAKALTVLLCWRISVVNHWRVNIIVAKLYNLLQVRKKRERHLFKLSLPINDQADVVY